MVKKIAQIQFTQQQLEQLEDLKRQTGLNPTEFVRRAVDYCILQMRDRGYESTLIPLPTIGTTEAH
ncbi:MAG: hypothetical protein OXC27_03840 [Caldilineaceae bacterium]|nr:hypothetical protein [Caldilineaceae bacterium]